MLLARSLAPVLFDDDDKESAAKLRGSIVVPVRRSPSAQRKARCQFRAHSGISL